MEDKDYYLILSVSPGASLAEINAAYLRLARRHHPDADASPESIDKFKQINEAYEILSDQRKREEFDRRQVRHRTGSPRAAPGPAGTSKRTFRTAAARGGQWRAAADEVQVELPITPEEARQGGQCEFVLVLPASCASCGGRGRRELVECDVCLGSGKVRLRRQLQVVLPSGLATGSLIRVAGLFGDTGSRELLLRIQVQPCW